MRRRSSMLLPRLMAAAVAALSLALPGGPASASEAAAKKSAAKETVFETPTEEEFGRDMPAGHTLTGEELYDRFLKNRRKLRSAIQLSHSVSRDPAGNEQRVNFWTRWLDYRDEDDEPVDGVESKTLLKLTGPFEMRHTGYLYIHYDEREDESFMWSPHRRRTARTSLKGQTIAGTDFSFDDFLLTTDDVEDGIYKRLDDETVAGVSCYVVDAVMKASSRASYTRSIVWLEKEHYVPLKARYWDSAGVQSKELTAEHASIKEYDGAWIATRTRMLNLLEGTETSMFIDSLNPRADLSDYDFSLSSLEFAP